jgi:hypothetical protein
MLTLFVFQAINIKIIETIRPHKNSMLAIIDACFHFPVA